jgi:mycoredoxin
MFFKKQRVEKTKYFIFIALCFFIFSQISQAELLKYTDDKGKTSYVDSPEKIPEKYKDQIEILDNKHSISRSNPSRENLYEKDTYVSPKPKKSKVEIFVASWCGYCRALEADLKKSGIVFQKYDIESSLEAKKAYQMLGGSGIPITRVNDKEIFRGYSSPGTIQKIKAALK